MSQPDIDVMLHELRVFPPPPPSPPAPDSRGFDSWIVPSLDDYRALHKRSLDDPDAFWSEQAAALTWRKRWNRVLEWNPPDAKWFLGGSLNACENCLDRHVDAGFGDETAILWEGEPVGPDGPEIRRVSFRELRDMTARCAAALERMGVRPGGGGAGAAGGEGGGGAGGGQDVVTIYMPMIPELAAAVLACARLGVAHSVIFAGFAPHAISERMLDADSRVLITADGGFRRGDVVPLLKSCAQAVDLLHAQGHQVRHVLAVERTRTARDPSGNRPTFCGSGSHAAQLHWWDQTVDPAPLRPCESLDSENTLFLLYTSGSTGKPKGIVHTTGGYLTYAAMTARLAFNLRPSCGQVFWCSADVGWITGHTYVLYGILANRVTTLMYEGAPNFPTLPAGRGDRFWDIIARHRVTQFYTAPTAIRTFMKWGDDLPARHDLSSLRVLGSVGEPINPEAWMWYRRVIGADRCPVVDTYWQTETGGHVVTPLPGATPTKPGSCTLPMPGIDPAVVNEAGEELPPDKGGLFVIRRPWPGMLRGVHGNRERFISNYFGRVKNPKTGQPFYFSADGARRDPDGYFWVQGRVDDVIKVSGHLLGTMEVESALVSHPAVAEAAVVGMPHDIKGNAICAFVTLRSSWAQQNPGAVPGDALRTELIAHVAREVGALAKPDAVRFTDALPKTRSGKIMRRLLRDVAAGVEKITQDTTTLEDFSVVARLRESSEE